MYAGCFRSEIAHAPHARIVGNEGIPTRSRGPISETGKRPELLDAKLLAVYRNVARVGQVVHVLAGWRADLSPLPGGLQPKPRNFN